VLSDVQSMGELLNKFFASVFSREQGGGDGNVERGEDDQAGDGGGDGEGLSVLITEVMVRKHLAKLGENKAPGTDGMGSSFVKNLVGGIEMPLVMLFKRSLETGQVPEQWKEANVTAIYKRKGQRCDPGNYRPVSLTSQVGKLFERIVRDYLVGFLEENELLRDSQHGFRTRRSCLTNLLEFLDIVSDCVDEGVPVDAVYLDFQKAFDKVSHSKLLSKMARYGIDDGVVRWVRNWLSGRRQRVVIEGVASGWELVLSGVPQGSVLGPVLFIVFIDDIDEGIRSTVLKFADDTKLVARVGSEEDRERLRQDLIGLYKWSEDWQMLFNLDKCAVMHFGFANEGMEVRLGDRVLGEKKSERDLGVIVQSDLKVDKQCSKAANEANRRLGMINRNFTCKAKKVILPLYKSIVRPHLDYCVQAWRPHYRKDIDMLEKVQRRATRMVEGLEGYSYGDRLRILGLTTLETRFLRADLIEVFKILRGFDKLEPDRFFQVVGDGARRGHSFKLFKKRYRLDVGKFKFASRVCEEWNRLGDGIVSAETLNVFKMRLDHHLRNVRGYL
jgi:ribonuclease P/MRP protein subunit RPP40